MTTCHGGLYMEVKRGQIEMVRVYTHTYEPVSNKNGGPKRNMLQVTLAVPVCVRTGNTTVVRVFRSKMTESKVMTIPKETCWKTRLVSHHTSYVFCKSSQLTGVR